MTHFSEVNELLFEHGVGGLVLRGSLTWYNCEHDIEISLQVNPYSMVVLPPANLSLTKEMGLERLKF